MREWPVVLVDEQSKHYNEDSLLSKHVGHYPCPCQVSHHMAKLKIKFNSANNLQILQLSEGF